MNTRSRCAVVALTHDGVTYDPRECDGDVEVIYDAAPQNERMDDSHFIHTWTFNLFGELIEEIILVW